jgi:adenosylhomocysteine nucleosidase
VQLLKIVVTFALESEFAVWRRMAHFQTVDSLGASTYLMQTESAQVYAVITGIGTRSVNTELRNVLSRSADLCIASGLAGSLRKQYEAGAILVAKRIKGSGIERTILSDESLVDFATQCGGIAVDSFFTSNTVVNSSEEKTRLGEIAAAVEMESFHILGLAEKHGVPAVAVRAISDAAETNVPIDFNKLIDDRGQIGPLSTLYEIAKAPARVPQLIRFGWDSSRARRHLAEFLDRYIPALPATLSQRERQ